MKLLVYVSLAMAMLSPISDSVAQDRRSPAPTKPTIVLVHGAFAESASWNGVIERLRANGYPVVAASNPLRSVRGDAASVASVVSAISTPVVLVGHSYGGAVITDAARAKSERSGSLGIPSLSEI